MPLRLPPRTGTSSWERTDSGKAVTRTAAAKDMATPGVNRHGSVRAQVTKQIESLLLSFETIRRALAGLIDGVLVWNAVPWDLGTTNRKPRVAEKAEGGEIQMLPELQTVVPLGERAKDTWRRFARPGLGTAMRVVQTAECGVFVQPARARRSGLFESNLALPSDVVEKRAPITADRRASAPSLQTC